MPLFALAKPISGAQKDFAGECKFVVKFGRFHTGETALKAIGTWLADIFRGENPPAVTAESLIYCAQIITTRYTHRVSTESPYILSKRTYRKYVEYVTKLIVLLEG